MEERRSTRSLIHCPVVFIGDFMVGKGTMTDLSPTGCGITTTTLLRQGLYISLSVTTPDAQTPISINLAAVRWALGGSCGLEFLRIRADHRDRLGRLVEPPAELS